MMERLGQPIGVPGVGIPGDDVSPMEGLGMASLIAESGYVYTRPVPAEYKPPTPTRESILRGIEHAKQLHSLRDQWIIAGRRLTRLANDWAVAISQDRSRDTEDNELSILKLTLPATIIKDMTSSLLRLEAVYKTAAENSSRAAEEAALKIDQFLLYYRDQSNLDYVRSGNSTSMDAGRYEYSLEDGQVFELLGYNPKASNFPYVKRLFDPLKCFPVFSGSKMLCCYTETRASSYTLAATWGKAKLGVDELRLDDDLTVISYFDEEWHAVLLKESGRWLKKPTRHGYPFCPIRATYFRGHHGHQTGRDVHLGADELEATRGRGILWDYFSEFDQYTKLFGQMLYAANLAANPPIKKKRGPMEQPFEINADPGEETDLPPGADFEAASMTTDFPMMTVAMEALLTSIAHGTVPLGTDKYESGFDRLVAAQKNTSSLIPYIVGMQTHMALDAIDALLLFKQEAEEVTVISTNPSGRPFKWTFTADMIPEDPYVKVTLTDTTPADKLQALQIGAQAYQLGAIDLLSLHEDILHSQNAGLIIARIHEDQDRQNPDVQKARTEIAILRTLKQEYEIEKERGDPELAAAMLRKYEATKKTFMDGVDEPMEAPPEESPMDPMMAMALAGGAGPGVAGPPAPPPGMPMPGPVASPMDPAGMPMNQFGPQPQAPNTQSFALPGQMTGAPIVPGSQGGIAPPQDIMSLLAGLSGGGL